MITPVIAALSFGAGPELGAVFFLAFGLFFLTLAALPSVLSFLLLNRIPVEHRQQTPGLAFLLLIPFFNLIWAFFVYPKIADSLQSYFRSRGENVGDAGHGIALATCICSVCAIIPLLGMFAGLAALVLLIIFFVKAFDLSGRIPRPISSSPTPTISPSGTP